MADCGAAGHREYQRARGFAVDFDYKTAVHFGIVNDVLRGVVVYDRCPLPTGVRAE